MDTIRLIRAVDAALRTTLSKVGLQDSNLRRETRVITIEDAIRVIMPDYAVYVDKGRKAGKMPPVKAIMKWMRDKGIRSKSGIRTIDIAYVIARSIGERGIKPRPFIEAFTDELTVLVMKNVSREIDNALKD